MPKSRSGIAAAVLGGEVFVFGGESVFGTFKRVDVFDPRKNKWASRTPMPTARHGLGSAVVGRKIFVISGGPTPGGSYSGKNEVFLP
jgi:N-acetylneuraminic acid mutarotase